MAATFRQIFYLLKNLHSFVKQIGREFVIQKMKKVISISLTFLMLTAMLHLSVATHYCGGKIAASKISLTGKLATCGMNDDEKNIPLTGSHYTSYCCENVLATYGINSIYFPSFSSFHESYQMHYKALSVPNNYNIQSLKSVNSIYTSVSPPDVSLSSSVDLSNICIFRI
jgi:hypothetical protein